MLSLIKSTRFVVLSLVLFTALTAVSQASVVALGVDTATLDGWRSTNVAKPAAFDPNGDNGYGSDGHWLRPDDHGPWDARPSYIGSVVTTGGTYGTDGFSMDDPDLPFASSVADMTFPPYPSVMRLNTGKILTITLAEDASFVLGLIRREIDPNGVTYVGVTQTLGGSDNPTLTYDTANGNDIHYYFFQLSGMAGDTFDVLTDGADDMFNGAAVLMGLTFETAETAVVPEPSTWALGLIGLAGLGVVVWRKRRK